MLEVSPPLHWVVSGIIDDCKGGHTFSQSKSSYKTVEPVSPPADSGWHVNGFANRTLAEVIR